MEHGFGKDVYALATAGDQLFAAAADGVLKQFDLKSGKELRSYRGHGDWIFGLAYDPESKRAVTSDYAGQVRVWNTATGESVVAFRARPGAPGVKAVSGRD